MASKPTLATLAAEIVELRNVKSSQDKRIAALEAELQALKPAPKLAPIPADAVVPGDRHGRRPPIFARDMRTLLVRCGHKGCWIQPLGVDSYRVDKCAAATANPYSAAELRAFVSKERAKAGRIRPTEQPKSEAA